jgi:hypothetical protein
MRKASVDVKTARGSYRIYRIDFKDERHYDNWCNAMEYKWGHKIIGVRFDDGYPGIDGFNSSQERNQKQ